VTAWDMLSEEQMQTHISTGCDDLDTILGGGIHCKEVTEVGKYHRPVIVFQYIYFESIYISIEIMIHIS
jgi:Rad51